MKTTEMHDLLKEEIFHVRASNKLSDSILNYFTMSIGLFFYGCHYAEIIFKSDADKLSLFYEFILIAGITQIILGIYDWYKGKTLTLLTNILFGLLFISWFFKYTKILKKEGDKYYEYKDKSYEGIIYILLFALSLVLIVSAKNKGVIYTINYLVLAISLAFVVVDRYAHKPWSKKVYGYCFIVTAGLFWITGLLRLVNTQFLNRSFFLVKE